MEVVIELGQIKQQTKISINGEQTRVLDFDIDCGERPFIWLKMCPDRVVIKSQIAVVQEASRSQGGMRRMWWYEFRRSWQQAWRSFFNGLNELRAVWYEQRMWSRFNADKDRSREPDPPDTFMNTLR